MNKINKNSIKIAEEIVQIKLEIAYLYNEYYKALIENQRTNIKVQTMCLGINIAIPLITYSFSNSIVSLFTLFLAIIPAFNAYKSQDRINEFLKDLANEKMTVKELKRFIKSDEFEEYIKLAKDIISHNKGENKNVSIKR